jgi:hypothetical protein
LENEGVETGKLLEKINQLEQQLTDIKSEPLENHWKIIGKLGGKDWQIHNDYAFHSPERSEAAREKAEKRWSKPE